MSESSELHPRVAAWLTRRGFPYIHEYKNKLDFVTINPQTGEITIIECKVSMGAAGNASSAIQQLNEYYHFLGIPSARRFCITLTPPRNFERAEFELNNVTCLVFATSMVKIECIPSRKAIPIFNEVFARFYAGKTIEDVIRDSRQSGMQELKRVRLSNDQIREYIKLERAEIA